MTKLNGKCNRCQGRGFRDTPVAHLGIPGLCYGCDGDGTYTTFARKNVEARIQKKKTDAFFEAYNMVEKVKLENGGQITLERDKRQLLRKLGSSGKVFSTKDYAEVTGLSMKEAWIELCRCSRGFVCPSLDENLNPNGWVTEM